MHADKLTKIPKVNLNYFREAIIIALLSARIGNGKQKFEKKGTRIFF